MIFLHCDYPLFSMNKISNILDISTLKQYPPLPFRHKLCRRRNQSLHFFLTITQYSNCLLHEKRPYNEYHPIIRKKTIGSWATSLNRETFPFNKHICTKHRLCHNIKRTKTIFSFLRIKRLIIYKNLNPLHTKIQCAKFG